MANPLTHARSLPEHDTEAGNVVAAEITVKVYASGALSVEGTIGDPQWAEAALLNAIGAIKTRAARQLEHAIVPAKDVTLG